MSREDDEARMAELHEHIAALDEEAKTACCERARNDIARERQWLQDELTAFEWNRNPPRCRVQA